MRPPAETPFANRLARLKWPLFAILAGVLAWRVVVVNLGDYHMRAGAEDAEAALRWNPGQPAALLAQGLELARDDPERAIDRLEQAVRANPADGRAPALLGRLWETRGELARADRAFEAAALASPRRTDVQAEVAAYWMRRGDLARALRHWDVVLAVRGDLHKPLFPELLSLAHDPQSHAAFAALLRQPVAWWPAFLSHAAAHSPRLDTLRALFHLPGHSANAAPETALRAYLARLQREGLWTEAYFAWLNSLPAERLASIDNLYNGSFEYPLTRMGFDWMNDRAGHILVEIAPTYGSAGERALHIVFRGPRVPFRHLYQHTLLPAGDYLLRGRVRPEGLEAVHGLEWTVSCAGQNTPLAASERFLGSDRWRHFDFRFSIPENCPVQQVRLQLAGKVALDYEARGGIWFDDLGIERLKRAAERS